jgi:hypothetical protein
VASFDDNAVLAKGTNFFVGSWVLVSDSSSGFNGHLIDPSAQKTLETTRLSVVNDFTDRLDKIPLPVHVKEVREQLDFDVTASKSPSKLEEDLDHLLEITRPDTIVN